MARISEEVAALNRIAAALENNCRLERIELKLDKLQRTIEMSAVSLEEKLNKINAKTSEMAIDVGRIRNVLQELRDAVRDGASKETIDRLNLKADEVLAATETLDAELEATGAPEETPAE